jgi:hypothetical protein
MVKLIVLNIGEFLSLSRKGVDWATDDFHPLKNLSDFRCVPVRKTITVSVRK